MMKSFSNRLLYAATVAGLVLTGAVLQGCSDKIPPGKVEAFRAEAGDGTVALSWTNPADKDLAGVQIRRKAGAMPTASDEGLEIFKDTGTGLADSTVTNGTPYYYAARAYDRAGNYSEPVYANATPVSTLARVEVLDQLAAMTQNISQSPALTRKEQAEMLDILQEAGTLFISGQPCDAAELLRADFLEKAQELRAGSARKEAEEYYAEGRMIRVNIARTMADKDKCPELSRIDAEAETLVRRETPEGLLGEEIFGEPILTTLLPEDSPLPGEVFSQIFIPGTDALHGEAGAPAVPMHRQLVAAPMGRGVRVWVREVDPVPAEEIFLNLYPIQDSPMDQEVDPYDFSDRPFSINRQIYSSNDPWPRQPVSVKYLGNGRDMEFYLVEAAAGQYYPLENRLVLFESSPYEIAFLGGNGSFATENMQSPFDSNSRYLMENVLNKVTVSANIRERIREDIFGEEFLILTHPDFEQAALELRDWKREKGIWANVFTCGTDTDLHDMQTADDIDAFIESRYTHGLIRPSYVLLLGDSEFIPTFYYNEIGTDWPYAVLGDPETDSIPDLAVGRIPVDTLDQATVVVRKIVRYEKNPVNDADFYRRAVVASQFQCCREGAPKDGTDSRSFVEVSEFSRQVLLTAGKEVTRIYGRTGDSTPARYYDGTLLPEALSSAKNFAWNGGAKDITNAWNNGTFLIIHRDHGLVSGWGTPSYSSNNILALTNGERLPVVFSINCATGFFDNETADGAYGTIQNGIYFAENALRQPNGGAVSLIAATRNSPSWENSTLLQGFMDAIWTNALPKFGTSQSQRRLGDILNHGKRYVVSKTGMNVMGETIWENAVRNELYLWHCIGDPTLELWVKNPHVQEVLPNYQFNHQDVAIQNGIEVAGGITILYGVEGAEITVFEEGPNEKMPIGRGVVKNGVAEINYLQKHATTYPLSAVANFENAPALTLEGRKL